MNNKVIKYAVIGFVSIVLSIRISLPASATTFIQCNEYVNIRQEPYLQSAIVGYIYDDNIVSNIQEEKEGWVKITSGNVEGWISKEYIIEDQPTSRGYTVAKIHPNLLAVYISPSKKSTIYTTVYGDQQIECIQYKNGWLTLAFDDGSYGFIDAYEAELKTYYGTAKLIEEKYTYPPQQTNIKEETYDVINQSDNQYEYYYQQIENENNEDQYIENYPDYTDYTNDYNYEENSNDNNYEEDYYDNNNDYDYEYEENEEEYYNEDEENYQEDYDYSEEYQETPQIENNTTVTSSSNNDIVSYADQFVGNPYSYGGNSLTNGIDCSHFVWQVLSNTGHYDGGYATSDGWAGLGQSVSSLDNAVAGDVIVYPGHVAIYDGEGGIVEAKGSAYGITHDREADHGTILAIRHFD